MKSLRIELLFIVLFVTLLLPLPLSGQKLTSPWTEWSKKDAEKILSDSPWAHTQVETNVAEMFYAPTSDPRLTQRNPPNAGARLNEGATNQEVSVKFGIRFFSARPIRQAFARMIAIEQKPAADVVERLRQFAEIESRDAIIIAVTYESTEKRSLGKVMQAFNSAITSTLKNQAYLEKKDGTRLFLEEYVPPGKDGFGARFIFPRFVDGRQFLDSESGEVRFYAEFAQALKLNMRFSVSQMMYKDKLEY